MTQIVMVAAAWHGGWALAPIARKLRARGHEVFTPTLTGLGERSHLARGAINLDTHIEDVINVVRYEQLNDIVLCAHSYAGFVITGVADRLPERIASLVYVDAFVPRDGESWWDLAGDRYRQLALDRSKADGCGVAPPEHLDNRCAPHPLTTFTQAIRLTGRWQEVREKVFVYASEWPETPFRSTYEALQKDPAWTVKALPTRHDIPRDAPDDYVSVVLDLKSVKAPAAIGEVT
ncbi:MAG TPA: alpha/beta hydrolase [Steroidobacteraceae bacterium]|nr:alpha/beta hydrolase [Steroidobacteraceae bacterium]